MNRKDVHERERGPRSIAVLKSKVTELAARTMPAHAEHVTISQWDSADGHVVLFAFSNEPENEDLIVTEGDAAVGRAGYLTGDVTESHFARHPDQKPLARRAGGCFGIYRADQSSVTATTDASRSNGTYWAEGPSLRIVGSRALLVALALEVDREGDFAVGHDHDLVALRSMASIGHFLGDQTPYRDVHALAEATCLRLDPWFARSEHDPVASEISAHPGDPEWRSLVEKASELLMLAFEPVRNRPTNVSLTGGRDSRLVASALVGAGIHGVHTATAGVPGHPDVDIAVEIASLLGLQHTVRPPAVDGADQVLAEDPLERIYRNLDVHDAMTSAWDDVTTYGPMSMQSSVSGGGGEILRGGMIMQDLDALDSKMAQHRLRTAMLPGSQFFHADLVDASQAYAQPWIDAGELHPHAAVDRYYYIHRNGRWMSARRSGVRFRAMAMDPLLDNRFVRHVLKVEAASRWSERLVFDMIGYMTPQIANLPLEGARWRFEREGPMEGASRDEAESWAGRSGVRAPTAVARFYWHALADLDMRRRVRALVAERLDGTPAELFDGNKVLAAFDVEQLRHPAFLWHVATACVILTDPWEKTSRPPRLNNIPLSIQGA